MANALAHATSPYLLQHRDNPVDWREWNDATLALAREADKPILLSVGYAACHWCHVMAHESFEDPAIAALMNRDFISVKVDREERPDLDGVYQQALSLMGEQGGWPLTMFLTPRGEPFWGGTYFPPEPRYGRIGFPQVLEQIAALWRGGRDKIDANREQLTGALRRLAVPRGDDGGAGTMLDTAFAGRVARAVAERFDAVDGGIAGAPKFPQSPVLDLMWGEALRDAGDPGLARAVTHTLARICQGGIYDHLGGGFARYSTDAHWLVPHFEKMLYDNAQLLQLLGAAHAATGEPLFRERAEETVAWLKREMMVGDAFASSLDADSEGEEGRFYVWDAAEIEALLGEDAPAFKFAYGVTAGGNWEDRNVLNRLHEPGLPDPAEADRLRRCRERLLAAREGRPRPGRDDKVLADWNGLTIRGLAEAGGYLGRRDWIDLAAHAFTAVVERMSTDGDGLVHSWREGHRLEIGFLDDHAQMSRAALALFGQTGEVAYLERARRWLARADADLLDVGRGAYYQGPADTGLVVRPMNAQDGPYPSGNGTMAQVAAELWHLTGDDAYRRRAVGILAAFASEARRNPFAAATVLATTGLIEDATQVVVGGEPGEAGYEALHAAAAGSALAYRVLHPVRPGRELPPGHPAHGKRTVDGRAAAYVCRGTTCEMPVTDAGELGRRLARRG